MSSTGWNAATVVFGVIACAALAISIVVLLRKQSSNTSGYNYTVASGAGGVVANGPGVAVPGTNQPIPQGTLPYKINDDQSITFGNTVRFVNGITGPDDNSTLTISTPLTVTGALTANQSITAPTATLDTLSTTTLSTTNGTVSTLTTDKIQSSGANSIKINSNVDAQNNNVLANQITGIMSVTSPTACCQQRKS